MTRETEQLVFIGLGLWLLGEWLKSPMRRAQSTLERGGAMLFDLTHADSGHTSDLPRPARMLDARRDKVRQWASAAGFEGHALDVATAVALAESGGIPDGKPTVSPREYSVGLFQINIKAHPRYTEEYLRDPINNARAAYEISKGGTNWHPWAAFTTPRPGKTQPPYMEFMP